MKVRVEPVTLRKWETEQQNSPAHLEQTAEL